MKSRPSRKSSRLKHSAEATPEKRANIVVNQILKNAFAMSFQAPLTANAQAAT
jgi:hypothetical protein